MEQEQQIIEAKKRILDNTASAADFTLVNSFIELHGARKQSPKKRSRKLGRELSHTRNVKLKK